MAPGGGAVCYPSAKCRQTEVRAEAKEVKGLSV
jgi:hypothetical protein